MKDHLFKKGNSGKPKGAISKNAKYIRDFLADVMMDNLPQLQADLDKMKPRDKWAILKGLSDKFLPDLTHTDIEANVNGQVKFIVEYVDSNIQPINTIESTNATLIEEADYEQLDNHLYQVPVQNGIEPNSNHD